MGHILFNLITGAVALSLLPLLMWVVGLLAVVLALFHTVFNLLGVMIMLPLAGRLTILLDRLFRNGESLDRALRIARYLDEAVRLSVTATDQLLGALSSTRRMVEPLVMPPLITAGTTVAAYLFSDAGMSPLSFARMIVGLEYHTSP